MDVDRIATVLETHQIEWVSYEDGYVCGCDDRGELDQMLFLSDALKHQAQMIIKDAERAPAESAARESAR